MWLWPTCLKWKSKAIRLVSHVARHVHRIGYTRRWWGILKPVFGRAFLLGRFAHFQVTPVQKLSNPIRLIEDILFCLDL